MRRPALMWKRVSIVKLHRYLPHPPAKMRCLRLDGHHPCGDSGQYRRFCRALACRCAGLIAAGGRIRRPISGRSGVGALGGRCTTVCVAAAASRAHQYCQWCPVGWWRGHQPGRQRARQCIGFKRQSGRRCRWRTQCADSFAERKRQHPCGVCIGGGLGIERWGQPGACCQRYRHRSSAGCCRASAVQQTSPLPGLPLPPLRPLSRTRRSRR